MTSTMKIQPADKGRNKSDCKGVVLFGSRGSKWFERWFPSVESAKAFAAKRMWAITTEGQ